VALNGLDRSLGHGVVQRYAWNVEEAGQPAPVSLDVGEGLAQAAVGLHQALVELEIDPRV
jgi:hypothetical protein